MYIAFNPTQFYANRGRLISRREATRPFHHRTDIELSPSTYLNLRVLTFSLSLRLSPCPAIFLPVYLSISPCLSPSLRPKRYQAPSLRQRVSEAQEDVYSGKSTSFPFLPSLDAALNDAAPTNDNHHSRSRTSESARTRVRVYESACAVSTACIHELAGTHAT